MFLVVPAHTGCPGQNPESRKTVVCVCVCVCDFPGTIDKTINFPSISIMFIICINIPRLICKCSDSSRFSEYVVILHLEWNVSKRNSLAEDRRAHPIASSKAVPNASSPEPDAGLKDVNRSTGL